MNISDGIRHREGSLRDVDIILNSSFWLREKTGVQEMSGYASNIRKSRSDSRSRYIAVIEALMRFAIIITYRVLTSDGL